MRLRVAAFTSWDVFPFIINTERSGIPVNAGWEPLPREPEGEPLNRIATEIPHIWAGVRYDYFTYCGAAECLKHDKPRVLYISFGETDDWAHARRYDLYLDSARRTDEYIRRLWELVQSMPEYAGKTSFVLTTDHGRGRTEQRGVDAAHRPESRLGIGHGLEVGTPGRGVGCIGDDDRWSAERGGHRVGDAIEDGAAADQLEALGAPAETRGAPAREDGPAYRRPSNGVRAYAPARGRRRRGC